MVLSVDSQLIMAMSSETPRNSFSGAKLVFAERPRRDYGGATRNKKAGCAVFSV
jgi:hypothetical protein